MQLRVTPKKGVINAVDVKMRVKRLVQQAVESYLNEQLQERKNHSIAILLSYPSVQPDVILKTIAPLFNSYDVTLILSNEWSPFLKERNYILLEEASQQVLNAIVEKTSLLVVPAAAYRFISKLALTMDDELAVWLAIQYQLIGKPIVIANNEIELKVNQQILAPPTVQERVQSYIRQIQADQVNWVPLNKLYTSVEGQWKRYKEKKAVILAKHIETAHREGLTEINAPTNSLLTPAARDLAKELKIHITKSAPRREDS